METAPEAQIPQVRAQTLRETLNQRGEATLFCVLILVALSGLLTLSGLELQRQFSLLKKRTQLFLCTKEIKEELNLHLIYMGRLNWLIKNTSRAQVLAAVIPPLWPYIGNAEQLKRMAKSLQAADALLFEAKLIGLGKRGCPVDPRMLFSPYILGTDFGFSRTLEGAAKLRKKEWTYYYLSRPYLLSLEVNAEGSESLWPRIQFRAEEKGAMLSSLLSSHF